MPVSISIHVDGYYGLTIGVKNILNLLDKYDLKATFFVSMGKETGIFRTLEFSASKKTGNIVKRYTKLQIIRMLFFPKKLGSGNCKILKEIVERGHEVNPHCWSHMLWSKNFEKINIHNQFLKIQNSFIQCLGKAPTGFAPPTWKWDNRVLEEMKKFNYKYLCVKSANNGKPLFKDSILSIPLTFDKTPEELLNEGLNEEQIMQLYKKQINKENAHLYFHADFEGIKGINLFEKIVQLLSNKKIQTCGNLYHTMKSKYPLKL